MEFRMVVTEKGAKKLKEPAGTYIIVKGKRAPLYKAIGWAKPVETYHRRDMQAEQPVSLSDLRSQYQTKFGKRAYHGWDASTLQTKIAG
jgi:hypothetical protein